MVIRTGGKLLGCLLLSIAIEACSGICQGIPSGVGDGPERIGFYTYHPVLGDKPEACQQFERLRNGEKEEIFAARDSSLRSE